MPDPVPAPGGSANPDPGAYDAMALNADPVRILGISGSLRSGSYNTMVLNAAVELAPPGVRLHTAGIGDLPLYNDDVRAAGYPPAVQAFRDQVAWAEALLFVTPEYNYSVPGVLKNAIDWASRPPEPPFAGKAAAVMGAGPGLFGNVRAQYHLRQMGVFLDLHFVNKPEVMIAGAAQKFDAAGKLVDEPTRDFVAKLVVALRDFAVRLRTD